MMEFSISHMVSHGWHVWKQGAKKTKQNKKIPLFLFLGYPFFDLVLFLYMKTEKKIFLTDSHQGPLANRAALTSSL